MAWWNRAPGGRSPGAGGGWRRTGDSEWKKAQAENDLLRQVSRQSGRKQTKPADIRIKQNAPKKAAATRREREKATKQQREINRAQRRTSTPGRPMAPKPKPKPRSSGSPLGGGKRPSGGGRSGSTVGQRMAGGGKSKGSGRKGGGMPKGKRLL